MKDISPILPQQYYYELSCFYQHLKNIQNQQSNTTKHGLWSGKTDRFVKKKKHLFTTPDTHSFEIIDYNAKKVKSRKL